MSKVIKFGGTSVGSPDALRRAASITVSEIGKIGGVVVVSALSGTTDALTAACAAASKGDTTKARELREQILRRHLSTAETLGLLPEAELNWTPLFERLAGLIEGIGLLWESTPKARDAALAIGETLSATLFALLLAKEGLAAEFRDVRTVMATDGRHGKARPDLSQLKENCAPWQQDIASGRIIVTQGFIGCAPDGSTTTLGRGGSDTSATLLGEALGVDEVQIWTDVDGILSADPSLVPSARPIPVMSLREASALSAFGAKVIHADALAPVARCGLRLFVANTHRPDASRTLITRDVPSRRPGEVTSVAYKEGLTCLRFSPERGIEELLKAARRLQESGAVHYGMLASPEGALLAIRTETAAAAEVVKDLAAQGIRVQEHLAVVALVGEGMSQGTGRVLGLLASLKDEPIAGILAEDPGIALAVLIPEDRLRDLIPRLHASCMLQVL